MLSSARRVCGRREASRRTAPIPPTDCLPSSPQGGATGPSVPDQQAQEQLLPCRCHPVELCTTVIVPPGYPLTLLPVFPSLPSPDCHTPTYLQPLNICTKLFIVYIYLF